jgi:hypothetical protein
MTTLIIEVIGLKPKTFGWVTSYFYNAGAIVATTLHALAEREIIENKRSSL